MSNGFEPVSLSELKTAILRIIPGAEASGRQVALLGADGGDRVRLIGLASLVFFLYERGRNPGITTIADAILYCSTSLAAGHCSTQPVSGAGKLVGSLLLAVGKEPCHADSSERMAATLEAILRELKAHPPSRSNEPAPNPNTTGHIAR